MTARIITLCYRKLIDASAARPWDQLVFEDTYAEFRMQAQLFNPEKRFRTLAELLQHAPGADQLAFLVSAAARGYLQQLQGLVPDVVDNLGLAPDLQLRRRTGQLLLKHKLPRNRMNPGHYLARANWQGQGEALGYELGWECR
ncbi:hypothetical protein I2I05_04565 [Hymenobacter sp. BT683]|uniref:Uncharacterized protein n=1 Tax=Hymenobacter jeongseonensis TaxID=2791027 RepID=A0ABS0IE99_9BACT|nr:hypothetical protein [Hymenobacter jeongseonensis]MBF9236662.1 hypothetical protein [Hymenobacter jeongseonensis]